MSSSRLRRGIVVAAALAISLGSVRAALAFESARQQQPKVPSGEPVGGISCDAMEGQRLHTHQHLVILDRGVPVPIPPNVGQPVVRRCIYWVHTHTPDGIIHIEAPMDRSFTLADFFRIWAQPLSRTAAATAHADKGTTLKVWLDGKPYTKDPGSIPLTAHADIVIEAGPPFPKPPRFTSWGPL